ncbi:S8 family serine peptidase [Hyalangium versicolor]|uniref:S8 family serine peptidase n=1 Tax=Hyalangium versicolor TaxID=2861190 RepID=UPI001CCFB3B4|nr:S8 family serine peptidase [Hyalangium versicolor]
MDPGEVAALNSSILTRPAHQLIVLNEYPIDTDNAEATYNRLPSHLRSSNMQRTLTASAAPRSGQYLVQFTDSVRDEWLEELRATGVQIVSYIPYNTYVVRADATTAKALVDLKAKRSFVRFLGDYEPGFRLSPELRADRRALAGTQLNVVVQVIDGQDASATVTTLKGMASSVVGSRSVLGFQNVELIVDAARLDEIAQLEGVFAVEQQTKRRKLDEVQGQIVAGNISAGSPTGPNYLSWLTSKGFTSSQFSSFAVEVADDAYSLSGHPDLPSTRIAFQNNPTAQTGVMGGHGFLNSHIIGGYNVSTGSTYEDANGYNYGLGIAPYARLGITAIFGDGTATATAWESTAYGQGARISSNSWGYTGSAAKKYDTNAQEFDKIVRDSQTTTGAQQMVVVFAAGNDGSSANTVSSPATAKNVITVGASENVRQTGTDGCAIDNTGANSAEDIISFSSRGPVNSSGGDGRFKPDIVAPGTHIEAGIPQSNYDGSSVCDKYWPSGSTLYGWSSGTSHSCPAVAGGSALVYQDFLNKALTAPSPAMVKAYLMNSATYMTGTGANDTLPSNNQGMGRMNLGRAFDGAGRILVDQTKVFAGTGETYQVTGTVSSSSNPFRVTLAWTDAPGPTTGAPWVNNLDLEVTVNGTTYKGNVFSGANSTSGGSADTKNNVESVFLPAGVSGSFTVTVKATNIAGDGVTGNTDTTDQDFALVIYNGSEQAPTQPSIATNPASLGFASVVGGANPASQTLSITNSGVGTLTWSAASSAAWLTVSPSSGTAPSTITAAVDATGLAAGTYSAAITLTASGATNSPYAVPVTLTVSPQGQASYDATLQVPLCATVGNTCNASSDLLTGRAGLGPEPHQPNTLQGSCADGASGTYHSDESVDAVKVTTTDGSSFAPGKTVRIDATVYAYSTSADHLDLYYAADASSPSWVFIATVNPTATGSQTLSTTYTLPNGGSVQAVRAAFRYNGAVGSCSTGSYDDRDDVAFAVGAGSTDTTPPTTSITSPTAGASLSGTATLSASASDNVGVTKVEFYAGSTLIGTATTSPYSVTWTTTAVANGSYSLTTKAYDAAGNTGTSSAVAVTVNNAATCATTTQLLANAGFESGSTSWTATSGVINNLTSDSAARTGSYKATLGNNGSTSTETAYQAITIPATACSASFSFWLKITTSETTTSSQYDKLTVSVRNSSGTVLTTLATYSNLDKGTAYVQKTFDLSAYKGQTVQLFFSATEDVTLKTGFFVDDTALNVVQ